MPHLLLKKILIFEEEKQMAKYKIIFDGEEQDEVFSTEEAAEE